ncbi:histidine--tRNA ligase [Salinisphaera sp.]|uniref:histidine--tRNA ligase n=1 Tax=Salinisphaera sp. TaxID=1914330 RepID=UPI000C695082|nr:histidine--tRNA ligase [Salinisphaera sp.]MAS09006.1 histidine--tRNA ligase [Salinisphaera sp.]|tara:strand:+ start:418 stop:1692 length:1275 start_codon:yes stop_codon:yes gene_type:complete
MSQRIQSIRGMNDILPADNAAWATLERVAARVFAGYGYEQIRLPIMERTGLFKRAVGEVTDIVEKEMYTFEDRGGESLSLRPEGTAGAVRAGIEHGMLHNATQRLWYTGPMFRYERPQKGRYRQFHQFGVEAFGQTGPDVDIEQIAMAARLFAALGVTGMRLEINTLGTPNERADYRDALHRYFSAHPESLDDDSKHRLDRNPLRILDTKNPAMAELVAQAPTLREYLGEESSAHFDGLCRGLDALGIAYTINPRLVRGLDYYTRTVFEWITADLGAQDAVCSGGRFDGLVEQLGGSATPAMGFALGVERLIALMLDQNVPLDDLTPQVYLVHTGDTASARVPALAEALRDALPDLRLRVHVGGGSMKSQFKRADKSGAQLALVFGDDEAAADEIQIKPLTDRRPQEQVAIDEAAARIAALLAG